METHQVSVRRLVEFTIRQPDITPAGGSLKDMQEGTAGHKARQASLTDGWQSEVPLSITLPFDEGDAQLSISGRMDAYHAGTVPRVEEIKLWRGKNPPLQPQDAHLAQGICYAHMLCVLEGYDAIEVSVVYVSRSGHVRAQFDQVLTNEACKVRFDALLKPFLRRLSLLRKHQRERDHSLHTLQFPFEKYRAGQREMAVQVYTAIKRQKRLFAAMPTGTGKSIATLFPALKALGEGYTAQLYYLTARTTQRQGPLEALRHLSKQPLTLWTLTLDAKDKQCPDRTLCHPDYCPRAKGHFLREPEALNEMLQCNDWSPDRIRDVAQRYQICPFEFSLSLAELADVTICDYNYALDPTVHIQRIFDQTSDVTLLIDEAHNLLSRVRDMLSGAVDGSSIRRLRTYVGRKAGRRHPLYQAMTALLHALDDLPVPEEEQEGRLTEPTQRLDISAQDLADAFLEADRPDVGKPRFAWEDENELMRTTLSDLLGFLRAARREGEEYAYLWEGKRTRKVTAFALDVGSYFAEITRRLHGVVCFSATLDPLPDMKRLLGGTDNDACFSMPSPFDPDRLLLIAQDINTRYQMREQSCQAIATAIEQAITAKPGHYLVFFPSFAFMRQVSERLSLPFQMQETSMSLPERETFLAGYRSGEPPLLSLCVMGGIFSEGIDLPGDALDGVVIVGVGLPQLNLFQETLRDWYETHFGDGFRYAYQIPGMQKVAQAVGRVIRTENDRGMALLLDDRYHQPSYQALCPAHWRIRRGDALRLLSDFWNFQKE